MDGHPLKNILDTGHSLLKGKRGKLKREMMRRENTQPCSTLICSANAFRVLSIRLSISNATTVHTLKKYSKINMVYNSLLDKAYGKKNSTRQYFKKQNYSILMKNSWQ